MIQNAEQFIRNDLKIYTNVTNIQLIRFNKICGNEFNFYEEIFNIFTIIFTITTIQLFFFNIALKIVLKSK